VPSTTSTPSPAPGPGTQIAGKYRVERTLAKGGMGVVVLVRHEVLGQLAVIKLLLPSVAGSPGASERFLREARAAANLRSDHVARVFDVGALDDGTPYMLMEYLDGNDLAQELDRRGRLPVAEAVDHTLEALDAVSEAHAIGVIHRDLKPSNLFLVTKPDGSRQVKVLDFGISKVTSELGAADGAVTAENALLGSPAYMSPEQVRSSKDVDGRTDVWSLGVVLYELVTGRRAFDAPSMGAILSQILADDVPALTRVLPGADAGLERVIQRCLARDRDARYPSAAAMREALAPFGTARATHAAPASAATDAVMARTGDRGASGTQTTVAVSSERLVTPAPSDTAAPPGKRRAAPIVLGVAVLVVVGIWLVGRGGVTVSREGEPAAQPRGVVTNIVVTPGTTVPPTASAPIAPSASASAPAPIAPSSSASAAPSASAPARPIPPRVGPRRDTPSIDLNQRN